MTHMLHNRIRSAPSWWWRCILASLAIVVGQAPALAQEEPVTGSVKVRVVAQKSVARPSDQLAIAVVLEHAKGFHTWPAAQVDLPKSIEEIAMRTVIEVREKDKPRWISRIDGVQWPATHPGSVANLDGPGTIEVPVYSGRAIGFVRIVVAPDAPPGDQSVPIHIRFQACNEMTCEPDKDIVLPVTLQIVGAASTKTAVANEPDLFLTFDPAAWGGGAPVVTKPKPVEFNVFGIIHFKIQPDGVIGLVLLLALAVVGGVLLNFTPCVLPVIPIKIISLSNAAGNPRRCLLLGAVMSAGVVAFWLAIGGAIAAIASFKSTNALFQNPWVPLCLGVFMLAMGVGMFGLFNIKLPQFVYLVNPKNETLPGAFVFGILTGILSSPCTAPFGGAVSAWAAFQQPTKVLLTFAAIGVGMALPYLILTANPQWLKKMPRTGPASELIKQVMGFLILAVAAYFLGQAVAVLINRPPDPVAHGYWWVVGLIAVAGGLWLAWRTIRITRKTGRRVVFAGLGILIAASGAWVAKSQSSHGPVNWTYYTHQRFNDARARGDVIVMDFTAEYCLNCKALESTVLFKAEIAKLLNQGSGIVPVKADIQVNPEAVAKQREIKWASIPLLAIFGPGVGYDDPIKLDWYSPDQVIDAISKASGKGVAIRP